MRAKAVAQVVLVALLVALCAACGAESQDDPPLSVETVPTPSHTEGPRPSPTTTPVAVQSVSLVAVGDVMLGGTIAQLIREQGPRYPFSDVAEVLQQADVAFGNLEVPVAPTDTPVVKDYVFRADPISVEGLVWAGFDVLALANNHAFDHGPEGLLSTISSLDSADIPYAGAGPNLTAALRPAILNVNGLRIAFLAYANTPDDGRTGFSVRGTTATETTPGIAWATVESVTQGVEQAKTQADIVIVSLHSGYEYQEPPNGIQRDLAYAAVDAGAALVLGHHPHVLQGLEVYNGALIAYSLGNFVFELDALDFARPGLPSALSAILSITLDASGVIDYEVIPVRLDPEEGVPSLVEGEEARPVLERMERLSAALGTSP